MSTYLCTVIYVFKKRLNTNHHGLLTWINNNNDNDKTWFSLSEPKVGKWKYGLFALQVINSRSNIKLCSSTNGANVIDWHRIINLFSFFFFFFARVRFLSIAESHFFFSPVQSAHWIMALIFIVVECRHSHSVRIDLRISQSVLENPRITVYSFFVSWIRSEHIQFNFNAQQEPIYLLAEK